MADTHILVSIDDERAKYISEVISNKTCKKILDYLAFNEGTVSDISGALDLPINTVDYNVKKLLKSGLIDKKSFFWSTKGKKMPTYQVSNKKIIISPKSSKGYVSYIFAVLLSGFLALILRAYEAKNVSSLGDVENLEIVTRSNDLAYDSGMLMLEKGNDVAVVSTSEALGVGSSFLGGLGNDLWFWFLAGSWFTVLLFFIVNFVSEWRSK